MKKKHIYDNTHLTLEERQIIQAGIENDSNKISIAMTIGKDPTTVAKEIRKHREFHQRDAFYYQSICVHLNECGRCVKKCERYEERTCKRRDRSPGACNKCKKMNGCHLNHYFYYATKANDEYKNDLVDYRTGINLNIIERKEMADIIVPLINQGQSIYQIKSAHSEIKQSKRTIYNYIDYGIFNDFGINNISLKEKVKRKQFKYKFKKRKDPVNYTGRTYKNYLEFVERNPNISTVQMDTLYNNLSGPFIQTLIFEKCNFMIGFIHTEKTSSSMASTFDSLEKKLGYDMFRGLFSLILTDRGVEFQKNELFEFNKDTGELRLNIFYCDPMQAAQKPQVENNHNYVRDIIPNEISLNNITQDDIDLMFTHINNTPRECFNGKTPYEMFEFLYSTEILDLLNIKKLQRDEVILKPYLLKHKKK